MAKWSAWNSDVLPHLQGVPDPLVAQALCRAARDLFTRTHAWAIWLDQQPSVAQPAAEYSLDLPEQTEVVRIERATLGTSPIELRNWRQLSGDPFAADLAEQMQQGIVSRDRLVFTVTGQPVAGEALRVQVSLRPTLTAAGIDADDIVSEYHEAIAAGALSRLFAQPGSEWSNPSASAAWGGEYERLLASASVRVFRGHTSQTPRARVEWC
jgi:hypothetical protein